MTHRSRRLLPAVAGVVALLVLAACGGGSGCRGWNRKVRTTSAGQLGGLQGRRRGQNRVKIGGERGWREPPGRSSAA